MKKLVLVSVALLSMAASAQAAVVVGSVVEQFAPVTPSGVTFEDVGLGATASGVLAGDPTATFTGNGVVRQGSSSGQYATPAFDNTHFLAVNANNTATVTYSSDRNSLTLLIGSIDGYNTFDFYLDGLLVSSLSGNNVPLPASNTGDQARSFYVTFNGAFDQVVFGTGNTNALEIDNISAAVPEASTWAMMILGFLGLGFLGYRKSSQASGAAVRIA